MASKKAKAGLAAVQDKYRKLTFESRGNKDEFEGKLKDESGRVILEILENEDYNQLSRILNTSKHMSNIHDMRGLATYVWERNILTFSNEEKKDWNKKNIVPIEIVEKLV